MRTLQFLVLALCLTGLLGGAVCFAVDDHSTIGFYGGLKGSYIEVDVPKKGIKRFHVDNNTVVNNVGRTYSLMKLPKHSHVKIVDRLGTAVLVIVLEVPK